MPTQTLSRRLLYTMFPWYLALALCMMGLQLGFQYASVSQDIDTDLVSLARTVQPTVTAAVWELDAPHLNSTAQGIRQNAIVSGIEIDSVNGAVLLRDGSLPASGPLSEAFPSRFRQASVPLIYQSPRGENHLIGQLKLYTSRDVVWSRTRYSGFMVLLNSIVVTSGLWLIFSWTIRFRLSGTVTRVANAVANWRFQSDDVPVEHTDYPYHDELGLLVQALNDMLTTAETRKRQLVKANHLLAASEAELKAINAELEQRVKDRTAELQALFESASVGIALMQDQVILRCNRRMDELFGYDNGEQIGRSTRIWYVDDLTWVASCSDSEQGPRGETHVSAQSLVRKDGSLFWVRMSDRAVDAGDPAKGTVLVVEDITAEYAALEEMTKARMLAEQSTRMKSEFLANMSHEIRTPMNAILGMLYLSLKTELSLIQRNYLVKAQAAANSLLGIINDILDFSKIEAGKLEIEEVEFSLEATLQQLTDSLAYQAERKGVEFLIRYDATIPPTLVGDPLRLGQVLLNLCGNAIKFTERGEVELSFHCIEATATEISIQVSVRDTGIGMSEEVRARLFEKFTQADQSTTRRFGGTGLGLAICKNLVELMGGRIWLKDSAPDRGTTICFSLTFKIAEQARDRRLALIEQTGPLLKGIRVLVVDDSEVSREILGEMLRFFQLEVVVVASGPEALAQLETGAAPFDLVLMDWRIPGMHGDEVTRRIRNSATILCQPRIIMVTAYGREDVMRLAEQAGADGFLIKPVSPSTLLDGMLSALGRGRLLGIGVKETVLPAGVVAPFAGRRVLLVEDNGINREFAGQLLSREGFTVDEATNGLEAVTKVQSQDYDVVLMDIQMPVMDGLEAARQIRALAQSPGGERFQVLPIIAMSALAMAKDMQQSVAAGMNDHITKPVAPDILLAVLAKWIVTPGQQANAATSIASAEVLPPDLLALASLNAGEGVHRIGGRVEAYRKQLRRFREHYADAAATLEQLLVDKAEAQALEYCHELKGVIGNIGAVALYKMVDAIEASLRQGVPTTTSEFEASLRDVIRDIDSIAADPIPAPDAALLRLEPAPLRAHLARLAEALEYDLGAAEQLLAELVLGVRNTPFEPEIAAIAAKVDVFALDEALLRLKKLQDSLPPAG